MAHVDVYLFPCFKCGNPSGQMSTLVSHLKSNNVEYGMIWIDVEGPGTYWGSSTTANANFFSSMVSEGKKLGVSLGVYTSKSQWVPIMGSYTGGKSYPLWYAHYISFFLFLFVLFFIELFIWFFLFFLFIFVCAFFILICLFGFSCFFLVFSFFLFGLF
eukprot:Phypoly_transcript_19250.p1 GENE.Phypoly_transcript_19250~~Phypoly_transcript_19250.p1  ORF type:complete len:159 (-),score=12.46 Phypoly_transcript_19250:14-490(-)